MAYFLVAYISQRCFFIWFLSWLTARNSGMMWVFELIRSSKSYFIQADDGWTGKAECWFFWVMLLTHSPSREQGVFWGYSRTRCRDICVNLFGSFHWEPIDGDVSVKTWNTWWSALFSWELRVCFSSLLSSGTTIMYIYILLCSTFITAQGLHYRRHGIPILVLLFNVP